MLRPLPLLRFFTRGMIALSFAIGLFFACMGILSVQSNATLSLLQPANGSTLESSQTDQPLQSDRQKSSAQPVLIEMYLSQSCSSCVPAAAYVRELAQRDDVVILSWHVDYWDDLNVGRDGKWKDPYSDRAFTKRQRSYAQRVFNTGRVYTPQAIVAGKVDFVGSSNSQIEKAISQNAPVAPSFTVTKAKKTSGKNTDYVIAMDNPQADYEVMVVDFLSSTKTSILGGENAGVNWQEANVVTDIHSVGGLSMDAPTLSVSLPESDQNKACAIVLHSPDGTALAARYCPA